MEKTDLDRAGEAHMAALERLANAKTTKQKARGLNHAVTTFEAFLTELEKRGLR